LGNPICGLHGVYNLIEVISSRPNKNCDQSLDLILKLFKKIIGVISLIMGKMVPEMKVLTGEIRGSHLHSTQIPLFMSYLAHFISKCFFLKKKKNLHFW
jgi:hypothetical protein